VAEREVSLGDLEAEAERLWRATARGAVVWLSGEIGAGKTTFVQAVTRAAGAAPARSPTYALVHEYVCREGPIVHVDCYRLRHPDEAMDLDFPGLVRRARLLLVEWPERAGTHAPPPDVHVRLRHVAAPERRGLELVR
jgi:tRNA threonylcarbamoyladenosine biosynthesis protein TsaE